MAELDCDGEKGSVVNMALMIVLPFFIGIFLCVVASKLFNKWGEAGWPMYRAKLLF